MIKIVKPGKKEFTVTCPKCGCIFSYELPDIYISEVACPECGKHCAHILEVDRPIDSLGNPVYPNSPDGLVIDPYTGDYRTITPINATSTNLTTTINQDSTNSTTVINREVVDIPKDITLSEFLKKYTEAHDLCFIRESGWIVAFILIESNDLFIIHPDLASSTVLSYDYGAFSVNGSETKVPCTYIDIQSRTKY